MKACGSTSGHIPKEVSKGAIKVLPYANSISLNKERVDAGHYACNTSQQTSD